MALGEIGRVCGDLVGDDPHLDVVAVGQPEVLLRRDVAEERRTEPANHRGADAARDVVVARRNVGRQRAQRIERRLATLFELLYHIHLDLVHRHVAGAFDHDLHAVFPGELGQFPQRLQLGELSTVVGVGDRAGPQAVAQRVAHVVGPHDLVDLAEMRVEKTLLVMRQAPLRHDRAAARDDAGDPVGGQRDIGEPDAGVDREVVDPLLGLLDQRVAEEFPGQFLGLAADFFERLVDRHGADRHRRIADDPFADRVDVAAGRQVHDRVGAPARRPYHLLDLLGDRGGDDRVADIGVDLDDEIAADDHRLGFRVVDVIGDDRAAARDLVAHEFRRHIFRDRRTERLAVQGPLPPQFFAAEVLADRDILHLFGDDPAPRIGQLGNRGASFGAQYLAAAAVEQRHRARLAPPQAIVFRLDLAAVVQLDIAARQDPRLAQFGQAPVDVDLDRRVRIRTGGVVDAHRRLAGRSFQIDLAHRNRDPGMHPARRMDLARGRERPGGDPKLLYLRHELRG